MILSTFSCAYCPFVYLLWKNVYSNTFKIYLFWLHWIFVAECRLFFSCGEQGLFFIAECRLLIVVIMLAGRVQALGTQASVAATCGLISCHSWVLELRLSSCGRWAHLLCGMWDHPGPRIKSMSPALEGGFSTLQWTFTGPAGKSPLLILNLIVFLLFS